MEAPKEVWLTRALRVRRQPQQGEGLQPTLEKEDNVCSCKFHSGPEGFYFNWTILPSISEGFPVLWSVARERNVHIPAASYFFSEVTSLRATVPLRPCLPLP